MMNIDTLERFFFPMVSLFPVVSRGLLVTPLPMTGLLKG